MVQAYVLLKWCFCRYINGFIIHLEGVKMGTRCGNIDPVIVTFLMKEEGLSADEVNDLMNKKSGCSWGFLELAQTLEILKMEHER